MTQNRYDWIPRRATKVGCLFNNLADNWTFTVDQTGSWNVKGAQFSMHELFEKNGD